MRLKYEEKRQREIRENSGCATSHLKYQWGETVFMPRQMDLRQTRIKGRLML